MAVIMGIDIAVAAKTLREVLNSPIEGLTAMSRLGFIFEKEIIKQIQAMTEQGKIAEAEDLILQEVEAAYYGAAASQGEYA
jgi:hypothetical protein